MPIPIPKEGEDEQQFVSRCIAQLTNEDPDTEPAQRSAICYAAFRKWKTQGEKMTKQNKYDENGYIIVAESVKMNFNGYINEKVEVKNKEQTGK